MKYTRKEALNEFFDNLKHGDYQGDTKLYNKLQAYKSKYKKGTLGLKAQNYILVEYGGYRWEEWFFKD